MSDELKLEILAEASQNHIAAEMDAQILAFFGGSVDAVKRYAHLYVIETEMTPIMGDISDLSFTYTTELHTRIRLKTKEELEADNE